MTVHPIPVTILAGTDQSAIARNARRIADATGDRRIAVVGPDIPDGQWAQSVIAAPCTNYRTPGCDCCALRSDLIDVLWELSTGDTAPDWILLLEAPGSNPLIAVQTLLGEPALQGQVLLDGVVTAVDAPELSARLATTTERQVARLDGRSTVSVWTSTIALDGLARLTTAGKHRVIQALHTQAPLANVAIEGTLARGIGRRLHDPRAGDQLLADASRMGANVLEFRSALNPDRVHRAMQTLLDDHRGQLPLLMASLNFAGSARRLVVQGIHAFINSEWIDGAPDREVSRLLVIGEGVDRASLRREMALVHA